LYVLRKIKAAHHDKVIGCSSIDGRVYVLLKKPGTAVEDNTGIMRRTKVFINSHSKLVEFCDTKIDRPIGDFLENWSH
jgi:hypothetical protein